MLKSLTLKNYMSYDKYTFNFSIPSLVVVCGDIGTGKSAMLESINYTLYGITKVATKKLVRIGAESMECRLTLVVGDNTFVIRRGIRKSDKGYLDVKLNDEVVASGNPAQNYINEMLGVEKDLFTLTSFFGAGDSDTLINTLPSKRLETLQRVANIDPFIKFHKEVKNRVSAKQSEIATLKKVIAVKRENLPKVADINKQIKKADEELSTLMSGITKIAGKRKALFMEVERVSAFVAEREKLVEKVDELTESVDNYQESIDELVSTIEDKKKESVTKTKEQKALAKKVESFDSLDKINSVLTEKRTECAALGTNLSVYESGLSLNDAETVDKCPLCSSVVGENTANFWRSEVTRIKKELVRLDDDIQEYEATKRKVKKLVLDRYFLVSDILSIAELVAASNTKLSEYKKRQSKCETDKTRTKARIERIDAELKESVDVKERLEKLDREISQRHTRQGELEADIKNYKSQLKAREKAIIKIKADEKKLKTNFDELAALNLLSEGFSRYGIPFDLLEGLKRRISKEASLLFSYFSNGSIEVRDVESRGKLGVSYVLVDELGERDYAVLSTGQKALTGLCVRLAVSFILRASLNITTDLLILDEVAGNLSPKKREALVLVITGLLKKYFSQVFMVSHASLRDVFTDTFNIGIDGGKSVVERI